MSYADGTKYNGAWENDLRTGPGTFTDAKGTKFEGHFEQNELNGQVKIVTSAGKTSYAQYSFGARDA
jgi:hypothetical protein